MPGITRRPAEVLVAVLVKVCSGLIIAQLASVDFATSIPPDIFDSTFWRQSWNPFHIPQLQQSHPQNQSSSQIRVFYIREPRRNSRGRGIKLPWYLWRAGSRTNAAGANSLVMDHTIMGNDIAILLITYICLWPCLQRWRMRRLISISVESMSSDAPAK